MTTIIGFADCGGAPLGPTFTIGQGESSEAFAFRWGVVWKDTIAIWINCHIEKTDNNVIVLAGEIPQILLSPPQVFFYEDIAILEALNLRQSQLTTAANTVLSANLAQISFQIDNVITEVSVGITDTLAGIEAQTVEITDTFLIPIEDVVLDTLDVVGGINTSIDDLIVTTLTIADDVIAGVEQSISEPLSNSVRDAAHLLAQQIEGMTLSLSAGIVQSTEVLREVRDKIESVSKETLKIAVALVNEIDKLIAGLPKGFDDVFRGIGNDLLGNAAEIVEVMLDAFLVKGREKIDELFEDLDSPSREIMENVFNLIGGEKGVDPTLRKLTNDVLHNPIFSSSIVLAIVGTFIISQLLNIGTQPEQQLLLQQHSKLVAWNIPPVDVLITAFRREFITEGDTIDAVKKLGFSQEDVDLFQNVDKLQLDASTIITLWLRKIIKTDELNERFGKLGFLPEDQELLKAHSQIVPGVADLIRFMVRDVFSPDITAKFGQFEGFPEEFKELGERIGLSEFWARNYWAAHWELPSITAGFEMLARGVINNDTFNTLLRAKDVMPFWRNKIKAIAFNPFTRVDVRRMHKFGILTEEQVFQSYKDLRYDDEKAKNLTAFTLKLNEPKKEVEFSNPVETPQRQIEGFLKRGIITESDAIGLLITLGFEQEDAELVVRSVDLFAQFEIRDEKISDTIELAVLGAISPEQAEEELFKAGFETEEVSRAINKIHTGKQKKIKIPSIENLTEMAKKGIISADVYQSALQNSGFSKDWAEKLTRLFGI